MADELLQSKRHWTCGYYTERILGSTVVLPGWVNRTEDVASLKVFICFSSLTLTQPKYWQTEVCSLTDMKQGYTNKKSVITSTAESQHVEAMLLT